ncbi:MAG: hypothetical protein ACI4MB_01250 [Candidatus Coproplasma sp.]
MTNLKVCKRLHVFIFISVLFIAIGMAIGTICHFVANGFFNYGGEFSSYKSISATYYNSENKPDTDFKSICNQAISGVKPIEVSYTVCDIGEEIVYKFSANTDDAKLQAAVAAINASFTDLESGAILHEGVVNEGGAKNIVYAAIALASAAAFQFLYYVLRYKLRAAFSALLACVHNLGIYAALLAVTRIPVGTEAVAIGAAVVLITMILSGLLFDRTRKNFKNEKYAKTDRVEVVETSASEIRNITVISLIALAIVAVVLGAFAAISAMYIGAYAPAIVALLGVIACCYGSVFFTPAVHGAIDVCCERVKASSKSSTPKKQKATVKEEKAVKEENETKENDEVKE